MPLIRVPIGVEGLTDLEGRWEVPHLWSFPGRNENEDGDGHHPEVTSAMTTPVNVSDLNRELARRINEEARGNPQSPFAGKFVGIVNGQVAAVGDDLDELVQRLRQVEADPHQTLCLEVGLDYGQVQDIWGLR
jgi:hypothetical protein